MKKKQSSLWETQFTFAGLTLPEHLAERCRYFAASGAAIWSQPEVERVAVDRNPDEFVLYWMRTALRVDENPALDVAKLIATRLNQPLLVYHGLSEKYQYASDRHHQFILEGARDVQAACTMAGISYAFHLERPGADGNYLRQLAANAAVVITEDMPVPPALSFLDYLAGTVNTPILCVDTACVVPMQLVGKAYDRAFEYRRRTEKLYRERVTRDWPSHEERPLPYELQKLPFQPVDLQSTHLADLIQECRIDHSVGPVADTIGGSVAGYNRWNSFKTRGLKLYAARRNNALVDGVSRMSAYLHYGMVSPMRIARESAEFKHEGAEKFLDELLIWRELAYCFCFHTAHPHEWEALPEWARKTLSEHAADRREQTYSWEELARAQTDDLLWNAAQRSLLIHGELHNNVRMTWGKAILNWTKTPEEALRLAFDLNDRFALDGRDPASVGGILWCFGQFDRPFFPEQPVYGTVRTRSTDEHSRRLDAEKFWAYTSANRSANPPDIAVIGAGIAGSAAARVLADHGLKVKVFDKSRGAGGRMATRRNEDASWNHGAPFFTARSKEFRRAVQSWMQQGILQRWQDHGLRSETNATRYVGVPGMSSIGKHLTKELNVQYSTQIQSITRQDCKLVLTNSNGEVCGEYDRVIIAIPAPQAASIIEPSECLHSILKNIRYDSVWALLLEFENRLNVPWISLEPRTGAISFAGRQPIECDENSGNNVMTARDDRDLIVVHSTADWAAPRLELEPAQIAAELFGEFERLVATAFPNPVSVTAHRWRYAKPSHSNKVNFNAKSHLTDATLLACGDWDQQQGLGLVESAWLSGIAAAGRILHTLNRPTLRTS